MGYPIEIKENYATAASTYSPVSVRNSKVVARKVNGMPLYKAKSFLNGLLNETVSIEGKHFTQTAQYILAALENAERNAKAKEFSAKLRVKTITCERGPTRYRRKGGSRRASAGARILKISHIKVVLEDMDFKKKEPKAEEKKPEATPAENKAPAQKKEAKK